jgi:hypothetical protein
MNLEQDRSAPIEREIWTSPDVEKIRLSELAVTQVGSKRIGIPPPRSRDHSLLASERHVRRRKRHPVIRFSIRRTKSVGKCTFEHGTRILGHAMQME